MKVTEPELDATELRRGCRLGVDSHSDQTVVGKHAKITAIIEGQTVEAFPFAKSFGSIKNLPIVNAAVAYDHPTICRTFILHLNHSIFVGEDSDHCLLCPNQVRENSIKLDDRPTHYESMSSFSIHFPHLDLHLPFKSHGPTAFLPIRRPTDAEYEECDHLDLTDPDGWNPYGGYDSSAYVSSIRLSRDPLQDSHPLDDEIMQYSLLSSINSTPIVTVSSLSITSSAISIKEQREATPERLAKLWGCGLVTAKRTLEATTHKAYREYLNSTGSLTRRFRTRLAQLRYRQLSLPHGAMYSDTMLANIKSIRGFTCGQLFCNDQWFVKFYPMQAKSEAPDTLKMFHQDVGVPPSMHTDNAPELIQGEFAKLNRKMGTKQTSIEPITPNQNRAELCMREFKKRIWRLMARRNVPLRLWCFTAQYIADIMCFTAMPLAKLQGRTSYEFVHGNTPDISEYIEFEFYDWIWYWDSGAEYPDEKKRLGRWLGVAHRVGQGMCYYILTETSKVIVRSTLSSLDDDEGSVEDVTTKKNFFTTTLESNIGNFRNAIINKNDKDIEINGDEEWCRFCLDDTTNESGVHQSADFESDFKDTNSKTVDDFPDRDEFDSYIGAQVVLPSTNGESIVLTKVIGRKRDVNGKGIGIGNSNPILDTRVYQVEYPDGAVSEYSANIIAENILSQVDSDGYNYCFLSEILGHRFTDEAIPKERGKISTKSGMKPIITTKGWQLYVRWKDQSTSWVELRDLKESNPVELAEYAVAHHLQSQPAFQWWVPYTIRKREAIISKVNSRFKKNNVKFGIEVPNTVEEALALDRKNGNNYWENAIKKEMDAVEVAFKFNSIGEKPPPGYKKITCHIIFDVKFDLTRKARYVAGGHLTDPPTHMTFATVVSRDSVRICLTVAALNDLSISACDIGNAYLNAETQEKVYFIAGSEWRDKEGRVVVIVRALYGLKSSALQWQRHLADNLRFDLGYLPSHADANVWMKQCHKANGELYYSYILCFVDDLLCVHMDPNSVLGTLKGFYKMKHDPEMPKMYLGSDIGIFHHEKGTCYTMGSDSYVKEAVRVVKQKMTEDGVKFLSKKTPKSPFTSNLYRPELDVSEECRTDQASYFQNLIGVLRWVIELGRVDILIEVSKLSHYLASPRTGHLHQALHIFHYLDHHNRSKIALNPTHIDWQDDTNSNDCRNTSKERQKVMKELYPDAVEDIPPNMPTPLGRAIQINAFFDADHAGDRVTRRSQSGIIIFLGMSPILWYSKRQNSVEVASFGSEFVAMRIGTELVKALRYKLRMFGIPIEGSANVFCDHQSVVTNVSTPESVLKRKHNSIAYHYCREAIASGMVIVRKVLSEHNIADLFTKCLPPNVRKYLTSKITV
jgi:hypothetical protein